HQALVARQVLEAADPDLVADRPGAVGERRGVDRARVAAMVVVLGQVAVGDRAVDVGRRGEGVGAQRRAARPAGFERVGGRSRRGGNWPDVAVRVSAAGIVSLWRVSCAEGAGTAWDG